MRVSFCDICELPIKPGDIKFAIVSKQIIEESQSESKDYYDYVREMEKVYRELDVKEICTDCKTIYDWVFNLKK